MSIYGTMEKVCPDCDGEGRRRNLATESGFSEDEVCHACGGTGKIVARASRVAIQLARQKRGERG